MSQTPIEKADMRWLDVEAYVGKPFGYLEGRSEGGMGEVFADHTEFLIEIRTRQGERVSQRIMLSNAQLRVAPGLYKWTLDGMVRKLDEELERKYG